MTPLKIAAAGAADKGNKRDENEDVFVCDDELGLYAVFDGMGGYRAGDYAAELASEIVTAHLRRHRDGNATDLADALAAACEEIFERARENPERRGMGTTAAVVWMRGLMALVAHVGDSRVYLLRRGKLRQITLDHTVVAAMLEVGALTPEEARHHPYQSVLSRCLGHSVSVEVDTMELALEPGDRLVICSDGLSGYASHEGIEQVVRGAESAESATRDLVDLALRGGGGDNIATVVVFAGSVVLPRETAALRDGCAQEWQKRRQIFIDAATEQGVAKSPVCAHVPPGDAVDIVAGNLFDAIYVDLGSSTGINVWTFGDNLANGWFGTGGGLAELSALMDTLRLCALRVIHDLAESSASLAAVLEEQVLRAFIVIESATAAVVASGIRRLEAKLLESHQRIPIVTDAQEQPTLPYLGGRQTEAPSRSVRAVLDLAMAPTASSLHGAAARCAQAAHELAIEPFGGTEVLTTSRELLAADPNGVVPLFNAMDQARAHHIRGAKIADFDLGARSDAVRRLALAYQSLAQAIAVLVVDAGRPISDELHEVTEESTRLREQIRQYEQRVVELTGRFSPHKGGR